MNLHSIYCLNQTWFPISNIISFYNIHYYSYVAHSRLAKDRCLFTKVRPHSKILLTTAIIPVQICQCLYKWLNNRDTHICLSTFQNLYAKGTSVRFKYHIHVLTLTHATTKLFQHNMCKYLNEIMFSSICKFFCKDLYTLVQMSFYYRYTACTIYQTVKRNCSFTSVYKRGGDWINA